MSDSEDQVALRTKIVVVGNSCVGKSSIACRYQQPEEQMQPQAATTGIQLIEIIKNIQGEDVKISIWDTAGQERYRAVTRIFFRDALGIVFVYDVNNRASFEGLERWKSDAEQSIRNWDSIEKIVIGNKIDAEQSQQRVPFEQAQSIFSRYGIKCFETSALTGKGVEESIDYLVGQIIKNPDLRQAAEFIESSRLASSSMFGKTVLEASSETRLSPTLRQFSKNHSQRPQTKRSVKLNPNTESLHKEKKSKPCC